MTLQRLEKKLDQLTDAVSKLILFEERQEKQAIRLDKVDGELADLNARHRRCEKEMDKWINRGIGVWTIAACLFTGIFAIGLKLLG